MKKKLKLGLFGFGCVGQGLYNVLHKTHGVKAEIRRICVKTKNKPRPVSESFFTYEKNDILNDPEIDVVVELIDDADVAFEILKAALSNGKAVVTANKKMLAEHLEEIYELQQKYQRPVLYEGAVCGSIPIIRNLEEYYDNDLIQSIEGIFNGSTNYILTEIFEAGKNYEDALFHAQELGFAETDPTLDVKAFDPKYKLVIAIAHTFGLFVKPQEVINIGIDQVSALDLKFARENNYGIKLVARAFKQDNKVYGFVAPQFITNRHPYASVRNEYNAVQVKGAFAEKQIFIGKGAGSYPTGSAVLSDISALTYSYAYEYKKLLQADTITFSNELCAEVFITFNDSISISVSDFKRFDTGYAAKGHHFMRGLVTLDRLKTWSGINGISIILAPDTDLITSEQLFEEQVLSVA
ncbi:MAG TPA: homoserine dehydrogenase [Chryseosolibacter sp.]|nr:homoserine dehydrogenase [Chryseosolibacter sp.]